MPTTTLFAVLAVLLTHASDSAPPDTLGNRFYWEGWHVVQARYDYFVRSPLREGGESEEHLTRVSVLVPFHMKSPLWLGAGLSYEYFAMRHRGGGLPASTPAALDLHALEIQPFFSWDFNEHWFVYAEADIGAHGDLGDIGLEDANVTAFTYVGWVPRKTLTMRLGMGVAGGVGDTWVYPVLGCTWRASRRVALDMFLPSQATLHVRVAPRIVLGLKEELTSRQFHLWDHAGTGTQRAELWRLTTVAHAEVRVWRTLMARVHGGVAYWREGSLDNGRGEECAHFDTHSGPLVGALVRWAY